MQGCRLRAKGEKIIFDTEDGEKEYLIKPIKNEQLLEIQELWDKKEDTKAQAKANTLFVKYSLNRDSKIVAGTEEPFTDDEIAQMETNFLIEILEVAARVNGMEKMVSFQQRSQAGQPTLPSKPTKQDILNSLNKNSVRTLS